jgi:hypothetical protein
LPTEFETPFFDGQVLFSVVTSAALSGRRPIVLCRLPGFLPRSPACGEADSPDVRRFFVAIGSSPDLSLDALVLLTDSTSDVFLAFALKFGAIMLERLRLSPSATCPSSTPS